MLAGSSKPFMADPNHFMRKEAEIMSSRYATRQEVLDSLELVCTWPSSGRASSPEKASLAGSRGDPSGASTKGSSLGARPLLIS
jgi:hypothetical protein